MKEKLYTINGNNFLDIPCIVKISFGNKYVIAKCKLQSSTLKQIENGLHAYLRGGKNNPMGIYYFLYEYVKKHPDNKFKVKTLLASESGYELLKREQEELDLGFESKNILNNQTEAYIPAYDEVAGKYNWLKRIDVLNFQKWNKKRKQKIANQKRAATILKNKKVKK